MISRRCTECPRGGSAAAILWMLAAFPPSTVRAAEPDPPVLEVPSHAATLLVAAQLDARPSDAGRRGWGLVECGASEAPVAAQIARGPAADGDVAAERRQLLAAIPPRSGGPPLRRFQLQRVPPGNAPPEEAFRFQAVSDASLGLWQGNRPVLVYNHGPITSPDVPENNSRRTRACYVHPVYGMNGEVLTDDFPRDHYHHHGIFWTWPHVRIGDREYDLWLGGAIEQRFVRWLARDTGPLAAVLGVENGWFVGDRKVMIERVWIRAFRPAEGCRSLDVSLVLIPTDQPVGLLGAAGKSYGGLTMRFAPPSANHPSTRITTPEGVAEGDVSVTRLPWADFASRLSGAAEPSGAAIFIHPGHPDYPPTWLLRHYGPLCVGWPGVVSRTLPPGQPVRLDYRIWIHPSVVDVTELKSAYAGFQAAAAAGVPRG